VYQDCYLVKDAVDDDGTHANNDTERYHCILAANLVKIGSQCPGGRVAVVCLQGCTAPARVAIAVNEDCFVLSHDRDHNSVVDKPAKHSAPDLSQEHNPRRNFD